MKIKIIIIAMACCLVWQACYEDKGNYDYQTPNKVKISIPQGSTITDVLVGKPYSINPLLTFDNPGDSVRFTYYWTFLGDTIATERNLNHVFDEVAQSENLYYYAVDPQTGYQSSKIIKITVLSEFSKGWAILAEGNNRESILGFVRPVKPSEEDQPKNWEAHTDLYGEQNNANTLGYGPLQLAQTFTRTRSLLTVMQENESLELDGDDYKIDTLLQDEFLYGQYPANFVPAEMYYTFHIDVIRSVNGNLLYRTVAASGLESWSVFYPSKYVPIPLAYEDVDMNIRKMCRHQGLNLILVYDRSDDWKKNRIIAINTNTLSLGSLFTFNEKYSNYLNLTNFEDYELVFFDRVENVENTNLGMLLKKENEYVLQTCVLGVNMFGTGGTSSYPKSISFPRPELLNENTVFFAPRGKTYWFFSDGSTLYFYDFKTGAVAEFFRFTAGNVVNMDTNPQVSELGVGLDNGDFCILSLDNEQFPATELVFRQSGFGKKTIDVMYKYENEISYRFRYAD